MQITFRTLYNILFVLLLNLVHHSFTQMPMPMGGMGGMPMPSPEELQQIEAEIDKFVRSLPPEQQAQFYKDVEMLTAEMEKMSPEQLDSFVGNVFSEAGLMEPTPAPLPEPVIVPEPIKEVVPVTPIITAPTGQTEKAILMLDDIINNTEAFLRKAAIIPELPGKMDKWVVQKKLQAITEKVDWETVQKQLEDLNSLLYTLEDKDPKTGQYRHIGNLIKDEALYNNLAKLQVTLQAYVPQVFVPEFGLDMVSKESRAAIREILSQYLESFYLLNIPEAIRKVQQLYEGRAKELTEEEKSFAERAKKESEKTRRQSDAVRSAGSSTGSTSKGYSDYGYGYDDYGAGYPSYSAPYSSYSPSSYGYDYPTPSYSSSSASTPPPHSPPSSGGKKIEGSKKEAVEGKEEKGKTDKKEGGKEKGAAAGKEVKKAEPKKNEDKDDKVKAIKSKLADTIETLKEFNSIFTNFSTYITDTKNFDPVFIDEKMLDLTTAIQAAEKQLKKSADAIKAFKKSMQSSDAVTRDYYKEKLKNSLKDAVKFFEKLHSDLKIVINNMHTDPDYKGSISVDKRYIFFGEDNPRVTKSVKDLMQDQGSKGRKSEDLPAEPSGPPTTMKQLFDAIDAFLKEAK